MRAQDPYKVLVVEDDFAVRAGWNAVFSSYDDFKLVGMTETTINALGLTGALSPDIIVMDLDFSGDGRAGARAIEEIKALHSNVRIMVYTAVKEKDNLDEAMAMGADYCVSKGTCSQTQMIDLLRELMKREAPPNRSTARIRRLVSQLGRREREVLCLVAKGLTNPEIAEILHLASKTVDGYVGDVLTKLGAKRRAEAVAFAVKAGLCEDLLTNEDD